MRRGLCLALALISIATPLGLCEEQTPEEERPFDPRLPPVLPGEEVKVGEETMKVWSTGGSPSSEVPPPRDEIQWFPPAVDRVIIREREEDRR